MHILIVDDEEICSSALSHCLELFGHQTTTATDGIEALARMEEHVPDVVISDIVMPRMDGLDLLKAIDERYIGLPVMLVTGQARRERELVSLAPKARACLHKPFDIEHLMLLLKQLEAGEELSSLPDEVGPTQVRPIL